MIRCAIAFVVVLFVSSTLPAKPRIGEIKPPAVIDGGISVWFSPDGGAEQAVVGEIDGAKKTLDMQAYSFTSSPIAKAIGEARERGVAVRVVLDKSQDTAKYSGATYLDHHAVPTFIDAKHAIAHNKIILIDGTTLITGSFNFTQAAEHSNAENLLIITGRPKLYAAYEKNFVDHLSHSTPYKSPVEK